MLIIAWTLREKFTGEARTLRQTCDTSPKWNKATFRLFDFSTF